MTRLKENNTVIGWSNGNVTDVIMFDGTIKDLADALMSTEYFDNVFFEDNPLYSSVEDVAEDLLKDRIWAYNGDYVLCIGFDNPAGDASGI